jgi:RNA polymerase sigma-70 factor, ECF subfamily
MIDRLALNAGTVKRRQTAAAGMVMNSSQELVVKARAGDNDAFRLLFERHARSAMNFLYSVIGDRDVAEELTQETFVRAFQNLSDFRDEAKFTTWLFGIGRNVAREWIRSTDRSRRVSIDEAPAEIREDAISNSPADDVLEKELNTATLLALQALDEDKRVVFILKVFQQCTYQEIADITGYSLAKVRTELHRARGQMRTRLRRYLEMH